MEEIETRLRETSDECLKNFVAWKADQKNATAREGLHDAIHELRKVASRLEIELAISERDQQGLKPMAIPPHRDSQNRSHEVEQDMPDFNGPDMDNNGNRPPAPRRMQPRQQGGGGGGPRRHPSGGQGQMGGGNRRPRDE
ncbi:MAG: hypothetical protein ACT4OY_08990 [Alphaproteobacteria bacterium]